MLYVGKKKIEEDRRLMKKSVIFLVFFFLMTSAANATREEIKCTGGFHRGWRAYFDRDTSFVNAANFTFENRTGKTAFKVHAVVNCYDFMDHYVGRVEGLSDGPISRFISFTRSIPRDTSHMDCEIYWTDNYYNEKAAGPTVGE